MKKLSLVCIVIKTVESQEGNKTEYKDSSARQTCQKLSFFSNLMMFGYEFVLIAPPE